MSHTSLFFIFHWCIVRHVHKFSSQKKNQILNFIWTEYEVNGSEFGVYDVNGDNVLTELVNINWHRLWALWPNMMWTCNMIAHTPFVYVCDLVDFMCRRSGDRKKGKSKKHIQTHANQTKSNKTNVHKWQHAVFVPLNMRCLLCYDLLNYCWSSFIVVQKGLVCEYIHSGHYDNTVHTTYAVIWWTRVCNARTIEAHNWFKHFINFRQLLQSFCLLNCTDAVQKSNKVSRGVYEKGERKREIMSNHQIISDFFSESIMLINVDEFMCCFYDFWYAQQSLNSNRNESDFGFCLVQPSTMLWKSVLNMMDYDLPIKCEFISLNDHFLFVFLWTFQLSKIKYCPFQTHTKSYIGFSAAATVHFII